jgi:hypothetical protein
MAERELAREASRRLTIIRHTQGGRRPLLRRAGLARGRRLEKSLHPRLAVERRLPMCPKAPSETPPLGHGEPMHPVVSVPDSRTICNTSCR